MVKMLLITGLSLFISGILGIIWVTKKAASKEVNEVIFYGLFTICCIISFLIAPAVMLLTALFSAWS